MRFRKNTRFFPERRPLVIAPRKILNNFAPYIAGRPIEEIKRIYKLKKVIKLASNENPYPPPEEVVNTIKGLASGINRYPDSTGFAVKTAIAKFTGVKTANIIIGSGTDEIIELLGKTYLEEKDRIIVSEHAFIRYEMAARLMNAGIKRVKMIKMRHDLKEMARAASSKDKFLFVANPNNPTGTYNSKKEIDEMFAALENKKSSVVSVFDEAYIDFTDARDYVSALDYFKKGKNIIVLRTMSKIYALAGLRFGFAVAPEEICEAIERIRPPFNTTLISQAAAITALKNRKYVKKIASKILSEKKKMSAALKERGISFVPSQTNFLLIKTGKGRDVFRELLSNGIIVRAMDEYGLPEYIRVTVGTPSENRFFLSILKKCLGGKK
ncbi:MAG: histidinol-phosphate transaminase [Elusimicrobia bacterium CG08_land_8_20_14_0_20_44_26]|nr:MAG: histidinol-phosphate transaminase [Elusimicrobia bacterium CG08_land_8_20_14_0_20_44_26]